MFAKRAPRPDRTFQDDSRLCHRRRNDRRIIGFLGEALMEEIAFGTPSFQRRFHRRRSDGQFEKSD